MQSGWYSSKSLRVTQDRLLKPPVENVDSSINETLTNHQKSSLNALDTRAPERDDYNVYEQIIS